MNAFYHPHGKWMEVSALCAAIMNGQRELDPDLQSDLHYKLSDLTPDLATLAIAHSVMAVSPIYYKASPAMNILEQKCCRTIRRGLKAYEDPMLAMQTLQTLSELIKINISFLKSKDETAAKLFKILSIQADAQAAIAEEVCRMSGVGTVAEGRAFLPQQEGGFGVSDTPL